MVVSHVGYNMKDDVHLTSAEHALAGAVSGAITRGLVQPLDVLKIRFQVWPYVFMYSAFSFIRRVTFLKVPHQSINFSKRICTHSRTKLLCHCGEKSIYRLDLLTQ